ncbi:Gfo/Idh/MocA family protein [Actinoplanes regularis]|uniref:Gfo/Idh/MocA family protein n=1 Tax=Actinoplanes regularis TaxID=52697 RepID=UPI0025579371|nr:Gfo/Idh/MocA family oxidoreductase [Actinoplanes regularis]
MVGYAFMGAAHSQAWRTVNHVYDLPVPVRMHVVAGRSAAAVAAAADRLGWAGHTDDWRTLLTRGDVDLIDICAPGDAHAEIAIAALAAGKHVLCEKPLANSVAEAREMVAAASAAHDSGVRAMCGFNYRRVPAVALMRRMVAEGRLGTIRHIRASYLQDWLVDPSYPLVWRLRREVAGSGALGDLGAHIIDLTQFVTGLSISAVCALTETFVKSRPLPSSPPGTGEVTVDDAVLFLARLGDGVVASYEATRFATGRKNGLRVEINGSLGALVFDFERMNELSFHSTEAPADEQGFTRVLVTEPTHPYMSAWWPPGHLIGYEHTFTHQAYDLVQAIAAGSDPAPSFADALQVQLVLDAVSRSAETSSWITVERSSAEPSG